MSKSTHNLIVKSTKFRKSLSLDKSTVKNRYKVIYDETFETSVPGTAAHIIYHSKKFLKNKSVLDLGCGSGRLSLYAAKYSKSVLGIDYIPSAIEFSKKFAKACKINNIDFKTKDLDSFSDEKFDVMFMSEVLQHVDNPSKTLRHCHKILKKNGLLIVNIPIFNNFRGNVWLSLQNLFNLPMSLTDTFQLSYDDMYNLSKKNKFKIIKTVGTSYDWAWSTWGIEDLKRRVTLAITDAKLNKITNKKLFNSWLESNTKFNKEFLEYLINKKIVKKRPKQSILKIPTSLDKKSRKYLDDGYNMINPFYCETEPFNKMGAGAIYFLKKIG